MTPEYDERNQESPPILKRMVKGIIELIGTILQAAIFAGAVILFVAQVSIVQGYSMEPNLHTDQRLIIDKLSYEFHEPARGDIVVVNVPDSEIPLIKRVIALPGELIEIRRGQVFIDGNLLEEPYLVNNDNRSYGPLQVPEEHLFVMGDNRPDSRDSRAFGAVDVYRILGKAQLSIWPPEDMGLVK